MFRTNKDGQIAFPPAFDDRSEFWWAYVSIPLHVPYFQIVCSEENSFVTQTILLQSADQLLSFIDRYIVHAAQIVTPGYMNGKGTWQIDVLKTVLRGTEVLSDQGNQFAYVYVVADGRRLLESSIAQSESELCDLHELITLP